MPQCGRSGVGVSVLPVVIAYGAKNRKECDLVRVDWQALNATLI